MKKRKFVFVMILIFIAGVVISSLFVAMSAPAEIKEFDMYLTVGEHIGFNVDIDAIYFGTLPQEGAGSRRIILKNDEDFSKKVKISASGELADWVWLEENNFVLSKNETKEVRIYVSPPEYAEFGNYTGKLRITFRKVYF